MSKEIEIKQSIQMPHPPSYILDVLDQIRPAAASFNAIIFNINKFMPFNREPKRVEFAFTEAVRIFSQLDGKVFKLKNYNLE